MIQFGYNSMKHLEYTPDLGLYENVVLIFEEAAVKETVV